MADVSLTEAADRYGTPLYLLDEGEVRDRCRAYRTAFPDADVAYAAKALLCRAMARWVADESLGLDVCSAGEPGLAITAGFGLGSRRRSPRSRETHEDLQASRPPGLQAGASGRATRLPTTPKSLVSLPERLPPRYGRPLSGA
ncbi:hypothetical protein Slala05_27960 [Streptomyces lavendulae subsp. lavendulae]|nr:hypothetical protein Slala05_27960 [Streptomyces lavendulae subsp. lavendulae]